MGKETLRAKSDANANNANVQVAAQRTTRPLLAAGSRLQNRLDGAFSDITWTRFAALQGPVPRVLSEVLPSGGTLLGSDKMRRSWHINHYTDK